MMSAEKNRKIQRDAGPVLENSNQKKTKKQKGKGFSFLKLALFLFILLLISAVAIYAFLDINPVDLLTDGAAGFFHSILKTGSDELKQTVKQIAAYESDEPLSAATVSECLAVASTSSVKVYDPEGREKAYIPVNLKKPFVQSCHNDVLIADIEGRYLALMNDGKLLWEKTTDEDIVNASISADWILLITQSSESGYKRTIRALSRDGQEVSLRNVSNYYPVSAFQYPEFNNSFVVSGIDASSLEANGLFEFLSPAMDQLASIRGDKEVFSGGIPLKKERLLLVGEKSVILIDKTFQPVWEKKMTDSTVTAADILEERYPVIAELHNSILLRENRHETTVRILNDDSSQRAELVMDDIVTGISSNGRTAAVIAGTEVFFINRDGKTMDSFTAKSEIDGVYLAKENLAYVISGGGITRIHVKVSKSLFGLFGN